MFRVKCLLFALLLLLSIPSAVAGRSCAKQGLSTTNLISASRAAVQLRDTLNAMKLDVAIIGRAGQDLSAYGLRYSHAGIAFRDTQSGRWRVAQLLNTCGSKQSELWYDGLGDFFLDDMFAYDALLLVPPADLAKSLRQQVQNPTLMRQLHNPAYNMVAYPFSLQYQNSNTWVIENVVSAAQGLHSRAQIQAWLQENNYTPTELSIGPLVRLGADIFKANTTFEDHPNNLRFTNRIRTVTVDSISDFLLAQNRGWQKVELKTPRD